MVKYRWKRFLEKLGEDNVFINKKKAVMNSFENESPSFYVNFQSLINHVCIKVLSVIEVLNNPKLKNEIDELNKGKNKNASYTLLLLCKVINNFEVKEMLDDCGWNNFANTYKHEKTEVEFKENKATNLIIAYNTLITILENLGDYARGGCVIDFSELREKKISNKLRPFPIGKKYGIDINTTSYNLRKRILDGDSLAIRLMTITVGAVINGKLYDYDYSDYSHDDLIFWDDCAHIFYDNTCRPTRPTAKQLVLAELNLEEMTIKEIEEIVPGINYGNKPIPTISTENIRRNKTNRKYYYEPVKYIFKIPFNPDYDNDNGNGALLITKAKRSIWSGDFILEGYVDIYDFDYKTDIYLGTNLGYSNFEVFHIVSVKEAGRYPFEIRISKYCICNISLVCGNSCPTMHDFYDNALIKQYDIKL